MCVCVCVGGGFRVAGESRREGRNPTQVEISGPPFAILLICSGRSTADLLGLCICDLKLPFHLKHCGDEICVGDFVSPG